MAIRVEFYGVARRMAGVGEVDVDRGSELRMNELLREVERRCPGLSPVCLRDGLLQAGWVANLDGSKFIQSTDQRISDGQALLILPADAGG